jgi:FkbH-like protein
MTQPAKRPLDYGSLVRASKQLQAGSAKQTIRVAILSDAASQQFVPLVKVLFHDNGVGAEIYEGPFDAIELEALNPSSGLYAFHPDVIVLANCVQALARRYYEHRGEDFLEETAGRMGHSWAALQAHSPAWIVQCNFPLPCERAFGHYDLKVPHSLRAGVQALNSRIAERARENRSVLICDVESLASMSGLRQWFDDRLWYMSKIFCNPECLPMVAEALVQIVLSTMGRVVKCVILDLDNTLWGGVVGDDGPLGVAIGPHGDGEPFYHFQHFLRSLKARGILLAVCSKNNPETALAAFRDNAEMVLKREDFAAFVANWENKADNIRRIRETLDIGFDSIVFLDDNPFERNLVREFLPDVIVPEMPEDPADYVRAVAGLNLFETSSYSSEDGARTELYRQEAGRRELQSTFADIGEFLQSLDMTIQVARFDRDRIPRIAQLFQRSNQFNLTTRRRNEAECERMMLGERCLPLYASLSDRFGDHGLISVVVLEWGEDGVQISDWLMSCRVLSRGVEQFLMTRVVELARQRGLGRIAGEYIPTPKNAMVKDFYAQFGFVKVAEQDGRSRWLLDTASYCAPHTFIRERAQELCNANS